MIKAFIRSLLFSFLEGMRSIKANKGLTTLTLGTIVVAMTFMGFFLVILANMEGIFETLRSRGEVIVYIKEGTPQKAIDQLGKRVRGRESVAEVVYVSKEEALADFKRGNTFDPVVMEGLDNNPLPASYLLSLKKEHRTPEKMELLARTLLQEGEVDEVEYGQEWMKKLEAFLAFLKLGMAVVGGVLALGLLFIVSNTVKLSVYSRSEEVEIMKLVGATQQFIKGPFLIEGVLQGFIGTALSLIILYGGYLLFLFKFTEPVKAILGIEGITFLSPSLILQMVGSGMALGLLGAHLALKDIIRMREEEWKS